MQTQPETADHGKEEQDGGADDHAVATHLPVIQENPSTLNDLVDISCRKYRQLPAIGMALEEPLTYKAFHERILAVAALLRSRGVGAPPRARSGITGRTQDTVQPSSEKSVRSSRSAGQARKLGSIPGRSRAPQME